MSGEKWEILTKKPFKRWDLLLVLACVLMLILPYVLMRRPEGAEVRIFCENRHIASFSLSEDREYLYEHNGIRNLIRIQSGQVRVADADCPDQSCRRMGEISRAGEVILCVPSGLKIEIFGGDSDIDGFTRQEVQDAPGVEQGRGGLSEKVRTGVCGAVGETLKAGAPGCSRTEEGRGAVRGPCSGGGAG